MENWQAFAVLLEFMTGFLFDACRSSWIIFTQALFWLMITFMSYIKFFL